MSITYGELQALFDALVAEQTARWFLSPKFIVGLRGRKHRMRARRWLTDRARTLHDDTTRTHGRGGR